MLERRGREVRVQDKIYAFELLEQARAFEAAAPDTVSALPEGCVAVLEEFSADTLKKKLAREKAIRDVEVQKMRGKARAKDRRVNGGG
jgi:hypothetical protein